MSSTSRPGISLFCAVALISGSGCTATRTFDPQCQPATLTELKSGDTVKVTLTDGREFDLAVVDATAEHIVGRDRKGAAQTISRQDISSLQVRHISPGRTLLLVGGVALLIGMAQVASAYDCLLGGSC